MFGVTACRWVFEVSTQAKAQLKAYKDPDLAAVALQKSVSARSSQIPLMSEFPSISLSASSSSFLSFFFFGGGGAARRRGLPCGGQSACILRGR